MRQNSEGGAWIFGVDDAQPAGYYRVRIQPGHGMADGDLRPAVSQDDQKRDDKRRDSIQRSQRKTSDDFTQHRRARRTYRGKFVVGSDIEREFPAALTFVAFGAID